MAQAETYRLILRRDTAENWASVNPILAEGEFGYETDTKKKKIGDGVTQWNELPYDTTEVDLSAYALKDEIPTKVSELDNDANYITLEDVPTQELPDNLATTEMLEELSNAIPTKTSDLANDSEFVTADDVADAIANAITTTLNTEV